MFMKETLSHYLVVRSACTLLQCITKWWQCSRPDFCCAPCIKRCVTGWLLVAQQLLPQIRHMIVHSEPAAELLLQQPAACDDSAICNMEEPLSKLDLSLHCRQLQPYVQQHVGAECTASYAPHLVHVTGRGGYTSGMTNKASKSENSQLYYQAMRNVFGASVLTTCIAAQAAELPGLDETTYISGTCAWVSRTQAVAAIWCQVVTCCGILYLHTHVVGSRARSAYLCHVQ